MNIYFSAKNLWFIPEQFKLDGTYSDEAWPVDAVLLTDKETSDYWKRSPPAGKCLGTNNNRPAWVDIPPLTAEELTAAATRKIAALRAEADAVITPMKDALEGGYIANADIPRLAAWQRYRYELTKVDPDNPVLPEKPAE